LKAAESGKRNAVPNINKPGPLDEEEWAVVRTHTVEGRRMLDQVGGALARVGVIVRASHERWDGGGYPDGLAGELIPVEARVVSTCDAFHAMTSDRSYRKALPMEMAVGELRACAGSQFDPRVVTARSDPGGRAARGLATPELGPALAQESSNALLGIP
jgi:HD-GYP domain-containing protein (c-di-GMP phosphodiesterase class II)